MGNLAKVPRKQLEKVAEKVVSLLQPLCEKVIVCGSLRRGDAMCGDVDVLVVQPLDCTSVPTLLRQSFRKVSVESDGERGPRRCYIVEDECGRNVNVDIWLMPKESFGSACLHCTGPGMFNTVFRRAARSRGMNFNVFGLFDCSGKRILCETEKDCLEAVGWTYLEPAKRSDWRKAVEKYLKEIDDAFAKNE